MASSGSNVTKTIFKDAAGKVRSHPIQDLRPIRSKSMSKGIFGVVKQMIYLFSQAKNPPRRPPPLPSKTQHARLITIKQSHYCEKGRWALDIAEADSNNPIWYTEDAHPPAFNSYATLCASADKASATPMIVLDDDEVLLKSDKILQRLCPQLYPEEIKDEILELEEDLHERLGTTLRVFLYHHMLTEDQYYEVLANVCATGTSKMEAFLFDRLLKGGIDKGIRKIMKINEESADFSRKEIIKVAQEISIRLAADNREYLMDTPTKKYGFTAADLTFSALMFALIRPSSMKHFTEVDDSILPPALVELSNQIKETPAGKHVLKCYKEYRPTGKDGSVELKTMPRDRIPWLEMGVAVGATSVVVAGSMRFLG